MGSGFFFYAVFRGRRESRKKGKDGMRPEEVFRLSDFSKEDFLKMMIKSDQGFSRAEFITKI